jgi:peroxiredoxin
MKTIFPRPGALATAALLGLVALATSGPTRDSRTGALNASGPAAFAAASQKPAPKKTPPAAAGKPAPAKTVGTPSEADKKAFMKVVDDIKQKIAAAPNKEKAARDGLARLQKYARDNASKPISDSASLTAAHLQYQLGDKEPALAAIRKIAEKPMDRQVGWAAQLSLAQLLAQDEKFEEAEKLLNDIVTRKEDEQLVEAAKGALAMLSIRPGKKPPEFTAKDTAGNSQTPGAYAGKVLLIDFWATWCGPCRDEMPNVKKVYASFKDRGFAILGISLDHQQATLDEYVKDQQIAWPQVFEGGQALAELYGVTGIPRMILLDRQGVIRYLDPRGAELETAVGELVGGEKTPGSLSQGTVPTDPRNPTRVLTRPH